MLEINSQYKNYFREDEKQTNTLKNLAKFEEKRLNTFKAMYQF